jgi:hypothetical protein
LEKRLRKVTFPAYKEYSYIEGWKDYEFKVADAGDYWNCIYIPSAYTIPCYENTKLIMGYIAFPVMKESMEIDESAVLRHRGYSFLASNMIEEDLRVSAMKGIIEVDDNMFLERLSVLENDMNLDPGTFNTLIDESRKVALNHMPIDEEWTVTYLYQMTFNPDIMMISFGSSNPTCLDCEYRVFINKETMEICAPY